MTLPGTWNKAYILSGRCSLNQSGVSNLVFCILFLCVGRPSSRFSAILSFVSIAITVGLCTASVVPDDTFFCCLTMRFENWDILLFPRGSKTPIQEFKTTCNVVHDGGTVQFAAITPLWLRSAFSETDRLTEFLHSHGSVGLPTVCCFVPSLAHGAPFQVSIHSWSEAIVSQYAKSYSKFPDTVKFEARLFIDGRLVAYVVLASSLRSVPQLRCWLTREQLDDIG